MTEINERWTVGNARYLPNYSVTPAIREAARELYHTVYDRDGADVHYELTDEPGGPYRRLPGNKRYVLDNGCWGPPESEGLSHIDLQLVEQADWAGEGRLLVAIRSMYTPESTQRLLFAAAYHLPSLRLSTPLVAGETAIGYWSRVIDEYVLPRFANNQSLPITYPEAGDHYLWLLKKWSGIEIDLRFESDNVPADYGFMAFTAFRGMFTDPLGYAGGLGSNDSTILPAPGPNQESIQRQFEFCHAPRNCSWEIAISDSNAGGLASNYVGGCSIARDELDLQPIRDLLPRGTEHELVSLFIMARHAWGSGSGGVLSVSQFDSSFSTVSQHRYDVRLSTPPGDIAGMTSTPWVRYSPRQAVVRPALLALDRGPLIQQIANMACYRGWFNRMGAIFRERAIRTPEDLPRIAPPVSERREVVSPQREEPPTTPVVAASEYDPNFAWLEGLIQRADTSDPTQHPPLRQFLSSTAHILEIGHVLAMSRVLFDRLRHAASVLVEASEPAEESPGFFWGLPGFPAWLTPIYSAIADNGARYVHCPAGRPANFPEYEAALSNYAGEELRVSLQPLNVPPSRQYGFTLRIESQSTRDWTASPLSHDEVVEKLRSMLYPRTTLLGDNSDGMPLLFNPTGGCNVGVEWELPSAFARTIYAFGNLVPRSLSYTYSLEGDSTRLYFASSSPSVEHLMRELEATAACSIETLDQRLEIARRDGGDFERRVMFKVRITDGRLLAFADGSREVASSHPIWVANISLDILRRLRGETRVRDEDFRCYAGRPLIQQAAQLVLHTFLANAEEDRTGFNAERDSGNLLVEVSMSGTPLPWDQTPGIFTFCVAQRDALDALPEHILRSRLTQGESANQDYIAARIAVLNSSTSRNLENVSWATPEDVQRIRNNFAGSGVLVPSDTPEQPETDDSVIVSVIGQGPPAEEAPDVNNGSALRRLSRGMVPAAALPVYRVTESGRELSIPYTVPPFMSEEERPEFEAFEVSAPLFRSSEGLDELRQLSRQVAEQSPVAFLCWVVACVDRDRPGAWTWVHHDHPGDEVRGVYTLYELPDLPQPTLGSVADSFWDMLQRHSGTRIPDDGDHALAILPLFASESTLTPAERIHRTVWLFGPQADLSDPGRDSILLAGSNMREWESSEYAGFPLGAVTGARRAVDLGRRSLGSSADVGYYAADNFVQTHSRLRCYWVRAAGDDARVEVVRDYPLGSDLGAAIRRFLAEIRDRLNEVFRTEGSLWLGSCYFTSPASADGIFRLSDLHYFLEGEIVFAENDSIHSVQTTRCQYHLSDLVQGAAYIGEVYTASISYSLPGNPGVAVSLHVEHSVDPVTGSLVAPQRAAALGLHQLLESQLAEDLPVDCLDRDGIAVSVVVYAKHYPARFRYMGDQLRADYAIVVEQRGTPVPGSVEVSAIPREETASLPGARIAQPVARGRLTRGRLTDSILDLVDDGIGAEDDYEEAEGDDYEEEDALFEEDDRDNL